MFVDRRYRGSEFQVAKKLLNKAIDWGNDNSIQEIYLGTTPQFKAAHRFYQKNGFTELRSQELPSEFPIMKVDNRFYKIALS